MEPLVERLVRLTDEFSIKWTDQNGSFMFESDHFLFVLSRGALYVRYKETRQIFYKIENPTYLYDVVSGQYRVLQILRELDNVG